MAKKKTTADKQIAKAILEAQPKNIKEANNLFQTGSTSGKTKEKESIVKAKSLPVRKSSSGDIEIQAPDKVIADFIKSEENKVSAGKKQSTINEYKRTNNREETLVRQKFGNAPTGDIRLSPAYVGSFEKDGRAQRPSPTGVNAFETASRRFAQKNAPYTNSPYSGKSYAELTNLRKGIERDMHSGKITQAQAEKEKNTIDMWRASAASKDELSQMLREGQSENARKRREYVMQGMSAEEATKKVMQESVIQVAMAAASGAISGGVMGTGAGVVSNMSRSGHMMNVGERLIKNPDRLNRILQIGVENGNQEVSAYINADTTHLSARQAGKMTEGIITDALAKKGDIASIARIIGALEGRDASYLGSKESFDTARAVLHFVNESTTKEDTALLERSSGAVTLLTAIEGDTKAWQNVKNEAVKDAEYRASRGFGENIPQMTDVQNDFSSEQTAEDVGTYIDVQEDVEETPQPSPDGDKQEGTETLIYSSERYDIPENSEIVNNIVVDEHSKRVMAEKPRAYGNIIRMARRMGMNVRFVKDLTDEDGKVLDGLITSKGVFINADAENPSRFAATHEFGHRMKQAAPKEWAKYQEYVINKLKKESFDGEKTAYDVLYEETRNAYGKDDTDYINEEIAVNYAGELFNNEEMLENFIREDKSLALRVRDWWYNVLESMGLLSEKKKAQQMWLRAYTAAAKNVQDGKVGAYSGEKFSIQRIVGEKGDYGIGVYLDSDLLTELTDEERIKAVKEHIKNLGGSELIAYDNDGNPIKVRVAKRSWKYENKNGAEIRANRDLTSYLKNEVKQEAIMLIDELMETAKYKTSEKAKYSHGWLDNYGKNNWDYWKVFIQPLNLGTLIVCRKKRLKDIKRKQDKVMIVS